MTFVEFKNNYKQLKTDEERTKFINNRISQLIAEAEPIDSIGLGINGSCDSFIAPGVGLASNEMEFFSKLSMDDMEIYKNFLDYIENDIDGHLYGEPSTINIIQHFIWNYFGYNSGPVLQRMDLYSNGNDYVSIKEFKRQDLAACSERSVMAQNILKFLGFDSELIFGKLNNNESHAYIIFKSGDGLKRILYDPMNPVEYKTDNGKSYCPGVCLMSEEEYVQLKAGNNFNFKYDLVKKLFVKENFCNEVPRSFSCDDIKYNLNDDLLQKNSGVRR